MTHWEKTIESDIETLTASDVHFWSIQLDQDESASSSAASLLSSDEIQRFERFKPATVRRRFALARGSMRAILGRYLNLPPASLEFRYGEQGKPSLAPEQNPSDLRFNLTHSHELAVLAVAIGREVGLDVEHLRDNIEFAKLALRYFSPSEARTLDSLQGEELKRQFFRIWTAKEAYIKAIGKGLRIPLDQFDIQVGHDHSPALLETRHAPGEKHRWTFSSFDGGADYLGTLAIEGPVGDRRFLQA